MIITSIHLIVLGERERLFAVAVVFVQFTKPTIMADWGVEHALAGMNPSTSQRLTITTKNSFFHCFPFVNRAF